MRANSTLGIAIQKLLSWANTTRESIGLEAFANEFAVSTKPGDHCNTQNEMTSTFHKKT